MTPAVHIGVFYDVATGDILRIMNPDYEEEIDNHHLNPGEAMIRLPKSAYAIPPGANAMTLEHVRAIIASRPTPR